jgi:hypothetical protein
MIERLQGALPAVLAADAVAVAGVSGRVGSCAVAQPLLSVTAVEVVMERYSSYLLERRCLARSTVRDYLGVARDFGDLAVDRRAKGMVDLWLSLGEDGRRIAPAKRRGAGSDVGLMGMCPKALLSLLVALAAPCGSAASAAVLSGVLCLVGGDRRALVGQRGHP